MSPPMEESDWHIHDPSKIVEIDGYLLGIFAALTTTLMYAITGVVSRRLKDVHFSVIQFHHAFIATIAFSIYNIILYFGTADAPKLFQWANNPIVWLKLLGALMASFLE